MHDEHDDLNDYDDPDWYEVYTIQDGKRAAYDLWYNGRCIYSGSWKKCLKTARKNMEHETFWPGIYYINERGYYDQLDPKTGEMLS